MLHHVSSRLDSCSVLLSGLLCASTKSLQMVLNAAAGILTRTRKFDHITPICASLHWLSVHVRSDCKVPLMTYKIVNGLAPSRFSDLIKPYVPSCALPSQNTVSRVKRSQLAARPFLYTRHLLHICHILFYLCFKQGPNCFGMWVVFYRRNVFWFNFIYINF